MTTSSSNRVSRNTDVTPDCVVQVNDENGFVAEAKLSLPRDESLWDSAFTQLEKYDDDLTGWWTTSEHIQRHDIIALIPLSRAVRFAGRLDNARQAKKVKFDRNVSVVGFFKQTGATKNFLSLKRERGKVSEESLDQKLRDVVSIDFAHLIREHGDRKFVEHMPPLPYLLQILWDNLFLKYAADTPKDESKGWRPLMVSVSQVTADLQDNYGFRSSGPRSPQIPQPSSVRKALDALVEFHFAERQVKGKYLINIREAGKIPWRNLAVFVSNQSMLSRRSPLRRPRYLLDFDLVWRGCGHLLLLATIWRSFRSSVFRSLGGLLFGVREDCTAEFNKLIMG